MSSKITNFPTNDRAKGADRQNLETPATPQFGLKTLRWYCHLTGDTAPAVHARRRRGQWRDGKHCFLIRKRLWIDMSAAESWVRSGQ